MFFKDLCDYLNKKNHLRDDNAYGFYKFVRFFHLTLTLVCFFICSVGKSKIFQLKR